MAIAKRAFSFNYKIIKKGNKENDPSLWIGATSLSAIDRVKISPMIIHLLCLLSYLFTYSSLFPLAFHSTPSFRQLILQTFVFSSSFLLSSKIKRSLIRSRRKVKKKEKSGTFSWISWPAEISIYIGPVGGACSATCSPRLIRSVCVREINNPDMPLAASLQRNLYTRRFITGETIL